MPIAAVFTLGSILSGLALRRASKIRDERIDARLALLNPPVGAEQGNEWVTPGQPAQSYGTEVNKAPASHTADPGYQGLVRAWEYTARHAPEKFDAMAAQFGTPYGMWKAKKAAEDEAQRKADLDERRLALQEADNARAEGNYIEGNEEEAAKELATKKYVNGLNALAGVEGLEAGKSRFNLHRDFLKETGQYSALGELYEKYPDGALSVAQANELEQARLEQARAAQEAREAGIKLRGEEAALASRKDARDTFNELIAPINATIASNKANFDAALGLPTWTDSALEKAQEIIAMTRNPEAFTDSRAAFLPWMRSTFGSNLESLLTGFGSIEGIRQGRLAGDFKFTDKDREAYTEWVTGKNVDMPEILRKFINYLNRDIVNVAYKSILNSEAKNLHEDQLAALSISVSDGSISYEEYTNAKISLANKEADLYTRTEGLKPWFDKVYKLMYQEPGSDATFAPSLDVDWLRKTMKQLMVENNGQLDGEALYDIVKLAYGD